MYLRFLAQGFVHETDDGHAQTRRVGGASTPTSPRPSMRRRRRYIYLTERFLDIRNVPRVRPTSPNEATAEDTTREDLRSRSPSPELPAPEYPDTDPLPKLGNSKQPCSNSHQAPTPKRFYCSITSSITPQSDNFNTSNLQSNKV